MARPQFIDLARSLGAAVAYAPDGNDVVAGRIADVSLPPLHPAELKNGAVLKRPGLVIDTASAVFDGVNDYVDTGWLTRTNLAPTPILKGPELGKWDGVGSFFINPATVTPEFITSPFGGLGWCWKTVTPGSLASEGCRSTPIAVTKGTTYRYSIYLRGVAGGEKVQVCMGGSTVGQVTTEKTLGAAGSFSRFDITYTASETGTAQIAVRTPSAKAISFFAGWALVEQTSELREFIPQAGELETGLATWIGTPYESELDSGPFARNSIRTYCGMARRESHVNNHTLMSGTHPGPSVLLRLSAGSNTVGFWPDSSAANASWEGAWPGDAQNVFWELVFNDPASTAELLINGVSKGVKALATAFNPGGVLRMILGAWEAGGAEPLDGQMLPFLTFTRELTAGERRLLLIAAGAAPPAYIPPPPQFSVVAVAEGGAGRGFDITDEAEGLQFSNVNPGGDEICTFTLHRSWFAANPEVGKGDLIRIVAGIDVLWQGRIEEDDRSTGDSESIGVTAYGLGNRLGDVTFREIYVDRDMSRWGGVPNPRVEALGALFMTDAGNTEIRTAGSGLPSLSLIYTRIANTSPSPLGLIETWYDAAGIPLGYVYLESTAFGGAFSGSGNWISGLGFSANESAPVYTAWGVGAATFTAPSGTVYAALQLYLNQTFTGDGEWRYELRKLAVYGRHGLVGKGTQPYGFSVDQIAGDMVSRATGVQARNISSFAYIVPQFTVTNPTTPKVGIEEISQYANVDYGVWGPNSPLDRSLEGYFDYTEKDEATQHWFATRADFDTDLTFHSETSTLYDTVDVIYTNEDGKEIVERSSIESPDLQAAGLSPRVYTLNAGTTTEAGAKLFAAIFLRLFAGFAPARGSGTLLGAIRHHERGEIPVYYMRADGSNIRVPDILPAETAFALDSTPDRRTIFPMKRVTVDLSGDTPRATVEFDQNSDALAALLAQQATEASLVIG